MARVLEYICMEFFLETKDLSVGYGRNPLIKNINISVTKGEILTVIGPNGAGKSTILKSISKQLKKMSGEVFVEEEEIEKIKEFNLAKKLAFVSTNKINQDMMSCEEVVCLGRYPHTGRFGHLSAKDKEKAEMALKLVDAIDIRYNDYMKVSDGQKQKVRIAMAICQEPDIIILDEPTSFLDIRHKIEVLEILKNMARNGTSVIMSLHELELVRLISDKVLCVDEKSIVRYAGCEEVFQGDFIDELYHVKSGSFHSEISTVFMKKNTDSPKVFVVAGNGTGISVFYKLSKKGIAFAAGILQENDIDAYFAKQMTEYVVSCPPFESASQRETEQALKILSQCKKVIVTVKTFGTANKENENIVHEAERLGIEVEYV